MSDCTPQYLAPDGQLFCADGTPVNASSAAEASLFDHPWDWATSHIWWIVLIFAALILLAKNIFIVNQKTAVIIERLGQYRTTKLAGLRVKVPFVDRVAERLSLQIQEVKVKADIKTSSNEFIVLPVKVFVRVLEGRASDAYYEVEKPKEAIVSLVQNEVKSIAAGMDLQAIFNSRDTIKEAVQTALSERLENFGYEITEVVIDNPVVPEKLQEAFNNVTAAQQEQAAATALAEALKVKMIGEATAEAESLKIKAAAIVTYRDSLAEGNAEAIQKMVGDTGLSPDTVLRFFAVTDTNDAVRDAAGKKGTTVVVATGNMDDGLLATLPRS